MAEMHPDTPLTGTRSLGERKVFFALKENLPAPFCGLHGVPLLTRGRGQEDRLHDGEIDFVLAHPELGLLVLEVKGGGIACDKERQRWTSTNQEGEYEIKNPYDQAKRNMYALIEELHASKLAKRFSFPIGYAVWFADIEVAHVPLGLSSSYRQITLDATSLRAPEQEVQRIFQECLVRPAAEPPGADGVREMVRHFVPSWTIPARLRTQLNEEEQVLVEATRSQFKVLSMLARRRRALICGTAGSGKTSLALEKARRLGDAGGKVLLLCYNLALAAWLRATAATYRNVEVFHYHGLCLHICKLAKHPAPQPDPRGDRDAYFRYELPEAMMSAIESVAHRYDAIIVDEAQDFDPVWWIGIEQLLRDPDESQFYLFYDDNQHIYGSRLELPIADPPLLLCENCRNTRTIFDGFMEFYRGDAAPEPVGPDGRAVELLAASDAGEEKRVVETVIRRLIYEERLPATAITILTGCSESKSMWKEGAKAPVSSVFSWKASAAPKAITCSTIHAFKGLESSVVIVTEIRGLPEGSLRELLYVAYSRAKFHLIVVGSAARFKKRTS
jgi:Nuclease-related domain/UvrD-like helicase C-terminal domain/AAA domain